MTEDAELEAAVEAAKEWLEGPHDEVNIRHAVGAALAAADRARWQTIDKAPRDAAVLVAAGGCVGEATYHQDDSDPGWYWAGGGPHEYPDLKIEWPAYPTCWQPLPQPPEETE